MPRRRRRVGRWRPLPRSWLGGWTKRRRFSGTTPRPAATNSCCGDRSSSRKPAKQRRRCRAWERPCRCCGHTRPACATDCCPWPRKPSPGRARGKPCGACSPPHPLTRGSRWRRRCWRRRTETSKAPSRPTTPSNAGATGGRDRSRCAGASNCAPDGADGPRGCGARLRRAPPGLARRRGGAGRPAKAGATARPFRRRRRRPGAAPANGGAVPGPRSGDSPGGGARRPVRVRRRFRAGHGVCLPGRVRLHPAG